MEFMLLQGLSKPKKRLFVGLLLGSLLLLLGMASLLWYLFINRGSLINQVILHSIAITFLLILGVLAFGLVSLVLTLWQVRRAPKMESAMRIATNLLFPMAMFIGRTIGLNKEKIRRSFIEVNNHLVYSLASKVPSDKILILVPHCLQKHDCPHKVTIDAHNCRRCGRCSIQALLELAGDYQSALVVATGGTLARRFIVEHKPQAIIAVACERDLTSGIKDTNPIPVLGILNWRPNGPCFDTEVDLSQVKDAIEFFREPA